MNKDLAVAFAQLATARQAGMSVEASLRVVADAHVSSALWDALVAARDAAAADEQLSLAAALGARQAAPRFPNLCQRALDAVRTPEAEVQTLRSLRDSYRLSYELDVQRRQLIALGGIAAAVVAATLIRRRR